jgi:serine/threonine protein kinase
MFTSCTHFEMQNYFQSIPESTNLNESTSDLKCFEYKGYHKFGRVLGRGRFGTVIECERKVDNLPIALKFFKCSGIHKWIPEHSVIASDEREFQHSEFLCGKSEISHNHSDASSTADNRILPSEVACLIRASQIPGVIKILDYLPASEEVQIEHDQEMNDENVIGIVLERNINEICLFDYLLKRQVLSENEAKLIVKQIVQINLGKKRENLIN